MAEIIVRASAKVGIIALVDEATGYQKVRRDRDLQLKLQAFIADDMQEWARMFPQDFWYELARLEGIKYSPRHRPLALGQVRHGLRLRRHRPRYRSGTTQDQSEPEVPEKPSPVVAGIRAERVNNQIQQVIAVMKTCDDMDEFRKRFARVFRNEPEQGSCLFD